MQEVIMGHVSTPQGVHVFPNTYTHTHAHTHTQTNTNTAKEIMCATTWTCCIITLCWLLRISFQGAACISAIDRNKILPQKTILK